MSVINTNVKSLIVQNAIKVNNRLMGTAMEQLSTGKRINSAKDDAAGLAVSENMTAQIRGLNMAVRNANDGISLLQTAEGAMIEQTNMLQRMRELSVQAANGTLSSTQRSYLNVEFNSLLDEINRIGNNTQWNGMRLLTGEMGLDSNGQIGFQVGAGTTDTETITVGIGRISSFANPSKTVDWPAASYSNGSASVSITTAGGQSGLVSVNIASSANTSVINANLASAINANTDLSSLVEASVDSDGNLVVASKSVGADGGITVSGVVGSATATVTNTNDSATNPALLGDFSDASISDPAAASETIDLVDAALDAIANQRAEIGAGINRLTYAADNLSNVSQNTSESRSRILDTDYAVATTELARTQIIQQASTAVLAQANAQPQTVLRLLQG
jgi:flagellin